jgi:ABC-2 type transport system permease protein
VKRAPVSRMLAAQIAMELRLLLRRGESVLVTLVIPPVLLVFLALAPAARGPFEVTTGIDTPARQIAPLLAAMLALAVMSTSMVSLGIATVYERSYGVLKRLGGSPLPRPVLIAAKLLSVCAIEAMQALLLAGVAIALGWQPTAHLPVLLLALLLGTAAFGGLGLWMAGSWRAEATLAGANGLYVLLLLFGGLVVPAEALPSPLEEIAGLLPSGALVAVLRVALDVATAESVAPALAVLAGWAVAAPLVAAVTFRWE